MERERQFGRGAFTVSLRITDLPCAKLRQPEGQPPIKYRSIGYEVNIAPLGAERLPGHVCASVQRMDEYCGDPHLAEKFATRGLKDALYATIRILSPLGYAGGQADMLSDAEKEENARRTRASLESAATEIYGGVIERVLDDFARLGVRAVCVPAEAADAKLADCLAGAGFRRLRSGALAKFFPNAGNEIAIRGYPSLKTGMRDCVIVNETNLPEVVKRNESYAVELVSTPEGRKFLSNVVMDADGLEETGLHYVIRTSKYAASRLLRLDLLAKKENKDLLEVIIDAYWSKGKLSRSESDALEGLLKAARD